MSSPSRYKVDITITDLVTRDTVYQVQEHADTPFGCAGIMRKRGAELGTEEWSTGAEFPHGNELRYNVARTLEQHKGERERETMIATDPGMALDPAMHINAPPLVTEEAPPEPRSREARSVVDAPRLSRDEREANLEELSPSPRQP